MAQIPPSTDPVWDRLVSGTATHKFTLFAANMAVARAVRVTSLDPARKPAMIVELHQFFGKFPNEVAAELRRLH